MRKLWDFVPIKELIAANGLNEYDFGARRYWQSMPHFTSIDPQCESFYWLSPYLYCANNPVNLVDPTGEQPNAYESAIMCGYVYHDKYFDIYRKALEKTDWSVSSKQTSITMNHTGFLENGLQSELFERTINGVTEYAYVFAGTNSAEDCLEDIFQLIGLAPQYENAISNARMLDKELGDNELTFLGQSLGGGLAAASSMATGRNAITFNRASVSKLTSLIHNLGDIRNVTDYVAVHKNMRTGKIREEPLSNFQKLFGIPAKGNKITIQLTDISYFDTHSIEPIVNHLKKEYGY